MFAWGIDAACTNSWMLLKSWVEQISLLEFRRAICQVLLKLYGVPAQLGRPSILRENSAKIIRRDGLNHWQVKTDHPNSRCRYCGKRTMYACEKYAVPLHGECRKLIIHSTKTKSC